MLLSSRYRAGEPARQQLSPEQIRVRDRIHARMRSGEYTMVEVACLCGCEEGDVLSEIDRYGLPVRTILCTHCGIVRSSPRLDEPSTLRFYEEDYRELYTVDGEDPELLFNNQLAKGRQLVGRFAKLVDKVDRVVEVGCGAGGQLAAFAELGKKVAGVDLGSEWLNVGRRKGIDLICGDAMDLREHLDWPADMVVATHVIEHFLELDTEIAKMAALLAPDGVMLLEVPGIRMVASGYRGDFLLYLQNAHNYHFTAATFGYALSRCGLDVFFSDELVSAIAVPTIEGPLCREIPVPIGEAQAVRAYLDEQERICMEKTPRVA